MPGIGDSLIGIVLKKQNWNDWSVDVEKYPES